MEFKKCVRCGCFFMSNNDVCCKCETKDRQDIYKLNTIIDTDFNITNLECLSASSGISITNLTRLIKNKEINGLNDIEIQ